MRMNVDLSSTVEAARRFSFLGDEAPQAVRKAVAIYGEEMSTEIKKQITRINLVDKGDLRSRTHSVMTSDTSGQVVVPLKYAEIHEFGGVIKPKGQPYIIRPKDPKGFLVFQVGGRTVFAKSVLHPPMLSWVNKQGKRIFASKVTIKEKRYVRDSVDKLTGEGRFEEIVAYSIERAARGEAW